MNKDMIKIIEQDDELKELIKKMDQSQYESNIFKLYQQAIKNKNYKENKTNEQDPDNMISKLRWTGRVLEKYYIQKEPRPEDNLTYEFMPDVKAEGKLFKNEIRAKIVRDLTNAEKANKGIYLHGKFGCGKTFILRKQAQKLAKTKKVIFVFYPEMVSYIKRNITVESVKINQMIQRYKTVDVLMLDDIGREGNTAYIRDEVLGVILQYRMMAGLPTYMTSNYALKDLRTLLAQTRDSSDKLRASAIIERIRSLMVQVTNDDKNYR